MTASEPQLTEYWTVEVRYFRPDGRISREWRTCGGSPQIANLPTYEDALERATRNRRENAQREPFRTSGSAIARKEFRIVHHVEARRVVNEEEEFE